MKRRRFKYKMKIFSQLKKSSKIKNSDWSVSCTCSFKLEFEHRWVHIYKNLFILFSIYRTKMLFLLLL